MQTLDDTKEAFDLLIDTLEAHGNPPLGERWKTIDKEGYHTYMSKPIDFTLVERFFKIAPTVHVQEKYQVICTAIDYLEVTYKGGFYVEPNEVISGSD